MSAEEDRLLRLIDALSEFNRDAPPVCMVLKNLARRLIHLRPQTPGEAERELSEFSGHLETLLSSVLESLRTLRTQKEHLEAQNQNMAELKQQSDLVPSDEREKTRALVSYWMLVDQRRLDINRKDEEIARKDKEIAHKEEEIIRKEEEIIRKDQEIIALHAELKRLRDRQDGSDAQEEPASKKARQ